MEAGNANITEWCLQAQVGSGCEFWDGKGLKVEEGCRGAVVKLESQTAKMSQI